MGLSRRTFLLTLGTDAAGATLPAPMTSRITANALEHLHACAAVGWGWDLLSEPSELDRYCTLRDLALEHAVPLAAYLDAGHAPGPVGTARASPLRASHRGDVSLPWL